MTQPMELTVDCRGIVHIVAWGITTRPSELITECGITARWKHLTLWWSPAVMSLPEDTDDVATCMTCLVSVSRPR